MDEYRPSPSGIGSPCCPCAPLSANLKFDETPGPQRRVPCAA